MEQKTFPYLEHEDTTGFNLAVNGFLRLISKHLPQIKQLYESLKIGEFNDEVWQNIIARHDFIRTKYNQKIDAVIEALDLPAGVPEIASLKKENPVVNQLLEAINFFESQLSGTPSINYRHYFSLSSVIGVDRTPDIKTTDYSKALELFRTYISSQKEQDIKDVLEEHAKAYTKLWHMLQDHQHPMLRFANENHLSHLYTRDDENNFVVRPGVATLLANMAAKNAELSQRESVNKTLN